VHALLKATLLAALLSSAAFAGEAKRKPVVAVLYFDYTGSDPTLGVLRKGLAQMLTSDLSTNMYELVELVEREQLQAVLEEQKLQQTDRIDKSTAVRIGKLLGARFLVLGAYFGISDTLRADARVVDVETGRIILSVGANGKPNDFMPVEQKLSDDIARLLAPRLPPLPPPTKAEQEDPPPPPPPPPPRRERPKQLKPAVAIRYSKALDALDRKDKETAKSELAAVVKEQPDFTYASADLDRMMK
jgi:TolB-like protein